MDTGMAKRALAGVATWTLWTQPAWAQQSGDAVPAAGEIVVTARKQSEPLARVAAPVSALDGKALTEGAIVTPDLLAERFVGLTVLPNATGNLIFVRGVGGFTLTANAEPAVGWNYDGVFVARPMGTYGQMFDLDRVELLKGPQGALHGRNATGGSVNLIPNRPVAGRTEASGSVSYGNYEALVAEGMVNLAIGETGALRISGQRTSQGSFLEGLDQGPSQTGLRVQLGATPQPGLSIRVAGDFTHLGGVGLGTGYSGKYVLDRASGTYSYVSSGLSPDPSTRSAAGQAFRQTIFLPTLGRNLDAQSSVPGQGHELYGALVEIKADLGFAEATLLPAWRYNDLYGVPPGAPFDYLQREKQEQRSLEARLAGRAGPIDWLAGAYLFGERVHVDYAQNFSTSLSFQDQTYRTASRAGFAQATAHLSPRLRLGGGVRVTDESKRNSSSTTTLTLACTRLVAGVPSCPTVPLPGLYERIEVVPFPVPAPGQGPIPILVGGAASGATLARATTVTEGTLAGTAVTWRGTVEADVGATGLVYATAANGYRAGGTNAAVGYETYKPEKLTAYTLGARWRHPRGWLSAAVEAFWWDYRDQHVSSVQPDLSSPPRNVNTTRNIGRSRIRGFDVELDLRPSPLTVAYARIEYLDSRYLDFTYPIVSAGAAPLTGCAVARVGTSTLYNVDCTAQRPFASPRWTLGFGARQGFDLGTDLRLSVMARTRYVSSMMAAASFLPEQVLPARWMSHAQMILGTRDGRYELAAFVHNIEGKRNPTYLITHPASNALVVSVTPPRTYGLRASARF